MSCLSIISLNVIGCAEVPATQPPLPRVLSAIFWDPESKKVLYPPYRLDGNNLTNPIPAEMADFEERVALGEITRIDPQPAKVGWAVWLNDSGDIHYSPLSQITRDLAEISEQHAQSAREKISARDYPSARTHALIADAANPQHRDRLVLRAAAEFCMASDPAAYPDAEAELALTETLASRSTSLDTFRNLVRNQLLLLNHAPRNPLPESRCYP
jgi:hypothetical protein